MAVNIVSKALEIRAGWQWNSYMDKVKWQTVISGNTVNILQYGINSGIITADYLNDASLSKLANYFMRGGEIQGFFWNDNEGEWELKEDVTLKEIGKKLWSDYQSALKDLERAKSEKDAESRQRAAKDNTRRTNGNP